MSTIGKIFVVVNLVLALIVLGAAGALLSRTDVTKKDVTRLQTELEATKKLLDEDKNSFLEREKLLNAEKQRLQEEKDDLEVARQTFERNNQRLETDNQQLRDDVTKINSTLAALESTFGATQTRVNELTDQVTQFRSDAAEAKTSQTAAEAAQREAEAQLAEAQRQIDGLKGDLAAAADKMSTNEKLLEVAKAQGLDVTTILAMPRIEANVAEIDDQYGFVILDKGKNDQVERGFTFEIHRDGQYLGRVKVDEVYNNYATARIDVPVPGKQIQRFDHASTYLN